MLWNTKKINPGALDDTRPQDKREKDVFVREMFATAAPISWVEKDPADWRSFSLRNQDGSGSCVKQSIAKLAEISYFLHSGEKVPFSAGFYKYRSNYPQSGMIGTDAFDIWMKNGITVESILPSQELSDGGLNELNIGAIARDTAIAFKISGYAQFKAGQDFDTIASTIQKTGKGVMVWFRFEYKEWTDIPSVIVKNPTLHHSVVAVDAVLYKGKRYLVIEDSWGNFNKWKGHRLISEEFFVARNTFAAYPINFKYLEYTDYTSPSKPKHKFIGPMRLDDTSAEIKALQEVLKFETFFPTNIATTGYYGALTAQAVVDFQRKYRVASEAEILQLAGRVVGPKTIEVLNQIYG